MMGSSRKDALLFILHGNSKSLSLFFSSARGELKTVRLIINSTDTEHMLVF